MARKNSKKFQLIITGYDYNKGSYPSKVTMITKEELESLLTLFEAISENKESYNWSSTDSIYQNEFGGWIAHLDALYLKYSQFKGNDDFERLVMKTFPERGYCDAIESIEINELKTIDRFVF